MRVRKRVVHACCYISARVMGLGGVVRLQFRLGEAEEDGRLLSSSGRLKFLHFKAPVFLSRYVPRTCRYVHVHARPSQCEDFFLLFFRLCSAS